jgi:hypothetical protein
MPGACRSSRLGMGAWMSQLIRRARTRTLKMGSLPLNSLPIYASKSSRCMTPQWSMLAASEW